MHPCESTRPSGAWDSTPTRVQSVPGLASLFVPPREKVSAGAKFETVEWEMGLINTHAL